jgi:hypothetical protein
VRSRIGARLAGGFFFFFLLKDAGFFTTCASQSKLDS